MLAPVTANSNLFRLKLSEGVKNPEKDFWEKRLFKEAKTIKRQSP